MAVRTFGFDSFGLRLLFAFALVFVSYNPSGYSYFHWLYNTIANIKPLVVIAGLVLVICWGIYLRATFRSLGVVGIMLALALFASFIWLFYDLGWIQRENVSVMTWLALMVVSLLLAVGMSWSHIRRRLSGQIDMDDVDQA